MKRLSLIVVAGLVAGGCAEPLPRNTGVYMLLDTSGTYTAQLDKAEQIINFTLTRLEGEDSFAVARIDTGSFSERDIVAKVTLDDRPSAANGQKRVFSETVHQFLADVDPASNTDITGGMLQAVEFLNEKEPGRKTIFLFTDLKEDLQEGYVRDIAVPLEGFEVVALNVTKLTSDNLDPREYLDRLESWKARVEREGGSWRVINDLDRLERLL